MLMAATVVVVADGGAATTAKTAVLRLLATETDQKTVSNNHDVND